MKIKGIAKFCAIALSLPFLFSASADAMTSSWDNGRVWSKLSSPLSTQFSGVAVSANGELVYALNSEGVQFSPDSGLTWETRNNGISDIPGYLSDIAVSADGAKVVAVANGNHVWRSIDFGVNWILVENIRATPTDPDSTGGFRNVSTSTTGQYVAIMVNEGYVLTSNDFGVNFTRRVVSPQVFATYMNDIEISGDGRKIIVPTGLQLGKTFLSSDYGVSFQEISGVPIRNWSAVEISGDGSTLLAAANGDNIWTSRDSGSTWRESAFGLAPRFKNWGAATMSYDGQMIGVVRYGYTIVTSASGGAGWEIRSGGATDADYQTIGSSSDGLIMFVLARRDGVYKSLPSWITTDAGTVTFSHGCSDTSTATSVQAQSVRLIIDTATVAADTNDYHYYTETNTALWGASYDYGSSQNEIDCSYVNFSGSMTLARGLFISSTPGYSETSTVGNAEFVQYIGNINPYGAGYFHINNCGNTTVPNINVANPCDFTDSDKQKDWPRVDTGVSQVVRSSLIRSGVSLPKTGVQTTPLQAATIFVVVKAKKSVVAAAPTNTSWVATETFTVTSA